MKHSDVKDLIAEKVAEYSKSLDKAIDLFITPNAKNMKLVELRNYQIKCLYDFAEYNKLSDLWEVYNKSWNKFNNFLPDFYKVMKDVEKLDSFDKTCEEIIDAWYDDIEKIFYSDDNSESFKLNYGFKGNDIFKLKKSRKSLKERSDIIFAKDVKRWMLSGNDINITFKDANELIGAVHEHRRDSDDEKAECFLCEDLTAEYTGNYFVVEVYNGKISEIKFQSYDWLEHYIDDYELEESL